MPKTKAQGILFGLIMSYSMAIGMEIYNTASALGFAQQPGGLSNLRSAVFLPALRETLCMGLIVFIVSNLWGNRIGAKIAAAQCDPARDHPTFCRLLRQAGTVAIMCPSMCPIGSILFQLLPGRAPAAELPAVWLGTPVSYTHLDVYKRQEQTPEIIDCRVRIGAADGLLERREHVIVLVSVAVIAHCTALCEL